MVKPQSLGSKDCARRPSAYRARRHPPSDTDLRQFGATWLHHAPYCSNNEQIIWQKKGVPQHPKVHQKRENSSRLLGQRETVADQELHIIIHIILVHYKLAQGKAEIVVVLITKLDVTGVITFLIVMLTIQY